MYKPYRPNDIEPYWQQIWEDTGLYHAVEGDDRPKFYCLDFFPYPSGDGLHVGHCRNYVPTDVISRYKRLCGFNVLHPMGWDAFGEPAEQYAVSHNVHPRQTTDQNTANFRHQDMIIGASYDWSREVDTSRPEYYRWTQWFFLKMFQRGLAYRDTNWQWWCPVCQTTLSSHEAVGGTCWRGHPGVVRREIPAWYFRITAYADELLDSLNTIDWPEPVKAMQRSWIGRSEGCEIVFESESGDSVPVFTTRPDTVFGVTFLAIAPEHPLVQKLTVPELQVAVDAFIFQTSKQSEIERSNESRPKTGVFTGGFVIHPLTGDRIPVWVTDYVLMSYGGGAVMGVPAHDERDFEFARQYHLPIQTVVIPDGSLEVELTEAYPGPGMMVHSETYDGMSNVDATSRITDELASRHKGGAKVVYRMRDWLISRQRYWGTPIPIVHCQNCGEVAVPEDQLPVLLPNMEDFRPDGSGRSPLARVSDFVNTTCPNCGGPALRETDTMGGFACSSWYHFRFTSPHYAEGPFDPSAMRYWMPVDLYVGGAEHAVLHLLYARYWTKVMADEGLVPFREPFPHLKNQGQLLALDGQRMSKSRGNVITPDAMVERYGADALRIYELFMAPFDQDVQWNMDGISGARRFMGKIWNLYSLTYQSGNGVEGEDAQLDRALNQIIQQVTERIEGFRFNTMVSALMEFVNLLTERMRSSNWHTLTYQRALDTLMILLAPAAPHISEELWHITGHKDSVHQQSWPSWDARLTRAEGLEISVQIDGKLRGVLMVPEGITQAEVEGQAMNLPKVGQHLSGRSIIRRIYIPGRTLNIVTQVDPHRKESG